MKLSVLIPVKTFASAKQRLSPVLSPEERETLAEAMFRDVLGQAASSPAVAAIYVVTADPKIARIASAQGAEWVREESEDGETEAVNLALAVLRRRGLPSALIIPADIPLLRSGDLELLLEHAECHGPAREFALVVPSRDHGGTNALLLSPPDLILPRFGKRSFAGHRRSLAARGVPYQIVENGNIGLDIDDPGDLGFLLSQETGGKTREKLSGFQWVRSGRARSAGA